MLYPENTAIEVDTNLVFEWGVGDNSLYYELQISIDAEFDERIIDTVGIEQKFFATA